MDKCPQGAGSIGHDIPQKVIAQLQLIFCCRNVTPTPLRMVPIQCQVVHFDCGHLIYCKVIFILIRTAGDARRAVRCDY